MKPEYSVTADVNKNRLYIVLRYTITKDIAERVADMIVKESIKLKPHFGVITDMTGLKFGHISAGFILKNAMEFLHSRNVGTVVRVVGGSKVGLIQFARLTQGFTGYKPVYVPTMQEAEKKLDNEGG
ncbi:MAG: hypothetical protein GF401_11410 [Chitinivibrionales bacterium]|nr:hypothetical protein [Chitinivibrionales bacterium]